MRLPMLRLLVVILLASAGANAAEDANARLEAAVKGFEEQVDKDFIPVGTSLDAWRQRKLKG